MNFPAILRFRSCWSFNSWILCFSPAISFYDFVKQTVMFHMVTSLIYGVTPILFSVIKGKTKTCATPDAGSFSLWPHPPFEVTWGRLGEVVVFSHHQQTQEKRISSQRGHFSASLKPNDSWILPPPPQWTSVIHLCWWFSRRQLER